MNINDALMAEIAQLKQQLAEARRRIVLLENALMKYWDQEEA